MRPLIVPAFLLTLAAAAQGTPKALLWRITLPGDSAVSYVVGTVHSPDARAYTHMAVVLEAMKNCSVMAGELDLADLREQAGASLTALLIPGGQGLKDLYSKGHYKKVHAALDQRFGAMAPLMEHIRPFYLMAAVSEGGEGNDSTRVLDQYLQDVARGEGHEVLGIETMREQLDAVNAIPLTDQAKMLYEAVTSKEDLGGTEPLLRAYADQDLDVLGTLMKDEKLPAGFEERLIARRNGVMVQRMDSLMRTGRTCLFAVGAAHLPTDEGVLAGLRVRGYVLSPLPDVAALRRKEQP